MKKLKRIFCCLIISFIVLTSLNLNKKLLFAEDNEEQIVEEVESVNNNEIVSLMETTNDGSTIPEAAMDVPTRVSQIASEFAKCFEKLTKYSKGAAIFAAANGFLSLSFDIVKMTGILGPDPEDIYREHLDKKLDGIDAGVKEVNDKVDTLQDTINAAIEKIDSKLDKINIKLDKANITNVGLIETELRNEIKNYPSLLRNQVHLFYDDFSYFIKDDKDIELDLPYDKKPGDPDITLVISVETLKKYYDMAKEDKPTWSAEVGDKFLRYIFLDMIIDIMDQDPIIKQWMDACGLKPGTQFGKAIEMFEDVGANYLGRIAAEKIAKAQTSAAETYSKKLIGLFTSYCNYLRETDNTFVSPVNSQFSIIDSTYAFQGDIEREIQYENAKGDYVRETTNLAKMAQEKYVSTVSDFGSYVGFIAKVSGNYTEQELQDMIYQPWAQSEIKSRELYNNFYHLDENKQPIKNYCYITKTKLEYKEADLTSGITMDYWAWTNGFGGRVRSYRNTYISKDWSYGISNSAMTSPIDLRLVHAHYGATVNTSTVDFPSYLYTNGVMVNPDLPVDVITKFIGSRNFTNDDGMNMFIKNCHDLPTKYEGKDASKGDIAYVSGSADYFKIRNKAVADTFNIVNGSTTSSQTIGAFASYYEYYTSQDDLILFWDAYYRGLNPIDIYNTNDKSFYSLTRYDKQEDPEERYYSTVNYNRKWASIVSVPLSNDIVVEANNSGIKNANILAGNCNFIENLSEYTYEDYSSDITKEINSLIKTDAGLNDCPYRILFNEENNEINKDTYKLLKEYLSNEENQLAIADTYNDFIDKITKNKNLSKDKLVIDLSEKEIESLVKAYLKDTLECEIINSLQELPKENTNKNYYNFVTGKLYSYNPETNKYEEYNEKYIIKDGQSCDDPRGQKISENKDGNRIIKEGSPFIGSKNYKLMYDLKELLCYELYFKDDGSISYTTKPYYEITPYLSYKNGNNEEVREINNRVLKDGNITSLKVRIPVLSLKDRKDDRIKVGHFENAQQLDSSKEIIVGEILSKGSDMYGEFKVNSFSYFNVEDTYKFKPIPSPKPLPVSTPYVVPNTCV